MSKSTLWKKLERTVANDIEGRVVKGSGSQLHAKGDVRSDVWLVECKSSVKDKVQVDFGWIAGIINHAKEIGHDWALAVGPNVKYTEEYFVFVDEGMAQFILFASDYDIEDIEIQGEKSAAVPFGDIDILGGPWRVKGKPWLIMNRTDFIRLDQKLRS